MKNALFGEKYVFKTLKMRTLFTGIHVCFNVGNYMGGNLLDGHFLGGHFLDSSLSRPFPGFDLAVNHDVLLMNTIALICFFGLYMGKLRKGPFSRGQLD